MGDGGRSHTPMRTTDPHSNLCLSEVPHKLINPRPIRILKCLLSHRKIREVPCYCVPGREHIQNPLSLARLPSAFVYGVRDKGIPKDAESVIAWADRLKVSLRHSRIDHGKEVVDQNACPSQIPVTCDVS